MNIAFDAKRLFLNYTGLGNYSRSLVYNMQRFFPHHTYHLYTPQIVRNKDTEKFFDESKFIIHTPGKKPKVLWRSFGIKKDLLRDNIDIFHGLSAEIPYGLDKTGIKTVVTIHDLIFKFFKKDYPFIDRRIYDIKTKYACRHADHIISISRHTTGDIMKSYAIGEEKISTVYLPLNPDFEKEYTFEELDAVKNKFNLPDSYFLYVGSITGRKNLALIIEALSMLDKNDYLPLVVVGKGKKYFTKIKYMIRELKLADKVIFLDNVNNSELPAIYHLSHFVVFPSKYEGFGIPVLEALQSNKPVLVSAGTSLEEVAGACGVVLNHNNAGQWAEKIKEYSHKKFDGRLIKEQCRRHLMNFEPSLLSKKIMDIYLTL